jgi:hypothetical protein
MLICVAPRGSFALTDENPQRKLHIFRKYVLRNVRENTGSANVKQDKARSEEDREMKRQQTERVEAKVYSSVSKP